MPCYLKIRYPKRLSGHSSDWATTYRKDARSHREIIPGSYVLFMAAINGDGQSIGSVSDWPATGQVEEAYPIDRVDLVPGGSRETTAQRWTIGPLDLTEYKRRVTAGVRIEQIEREVASLVRGRSALEMLRQIPGARAASLATELSELIALQDPSEG